jgi:hypothetical protein
MVSKVLCKFKEGLMILRLIILHVLHNLENMNGSSDDMGWKGKRGAHLLLELRLRVCQGMGDGGLDLV